MLPSEDPFRLRIFLDRMNVTAVTFGMCFKVYDDSGVD